MKLLLFFLVAFVSLAQCQNQHHSNSLAQNAAFDTLALQRELRDIIRMQLPLTTAEQYKGRLSAFSYSLKLNREAEPVWELVCKLHDPETQELIGGGRYLLSQSALRGADVRLVQDMGTDQLALELTAEKSQHFVWHPYTQEPDSLVKSVRIGWYQVVQVHTLERALMLLKKLVGS